MPAHGWFEIFSNLKRLSDIERQYLHPVFDDKTLLEIELIHIDEQFMLKYGNVNIPYIKGSDHIFIVVAYKNQYPLVTRDHKMIKVAKELGIQVYTPREYISSRH
jgi:predicted nucleic acid-binding protein